MAKKVLVIGTGYVGLPAAIMLANAGYEVVGVDIDRNIVEAINNGQMHIDEAELHALMQKDSVRRNLKAQHETCPADVFIIAVPTPLRPRKKVADLSHVRSAVDAILPHLKKGDLIILESTVPPLTCRETITPMIEADGVFKVGPDILLAHCPERILPGSIFHEIIHNDRIIGGVDAASCEAAREIYASFVQGELFLTDDVTAELCKLMENTYRDVNIALANEFSAIAKTVGTDIGQAIEIANKHPRVDILRPGIGVGGHCIPIDPWFIKEVDPENSTLIFTARRINEKMPAKAAARIRHAVKDVAEPKIIALGAAYKPDTYDDRESPALEVLKCLSDDGYDVTLADPFVKGHPFSSIAELAEGADCIAVLVEHSVFEEELERSCEDILSRMRTPVILRF